MNQLTSHFSLEELTASQIACRYGIDNSLPIELMPAMLRTVRGLERVRSVVGAPIVVSSGYRCPQLNKRTGGVPGSQHVRAEAADITAPGMTAAQLAQRIMANASKVEYDQLILEYPAQNGWVHVSFSVAPRGEVLTKTRRGTSKGLVIGEGA